jgi:hypothetical protein
MRIFVPVLRVWATEACLSRPDATGYVDDDCVQLGPHCWAIRQGEHVLLALTPDGNDAARIEDAETWCRLAEYLEART